MQAKPALLLAVLYACFLASLAVSVFWLPERVASHFDIHGEANAWMSRTAYLSTMGWTGVLVPLLGPAMSFVFGRAPSSVVNVPRREYWLAPAHRDEANAYFYRHSLWFACLLVAFLTTLHLLVVAANNQAPIQLSNTAIWSLLMLFLIGMADWFRRMIRFFGHPPGAPSDNG